MNTHLKCPFVWYRHIKYHKSYSTFRGELKSKVSKALQLYKVYIWDKLCINSDIKKRLFATFIQWRFFGTVDVSGGKFTRRTEGEAIYLPKASPTHRCQQDNRDKKVPLFSEKAVSGFVDPWASRQRTEITMLSSPGGQLSTRHQDARWSSYLSYCHSILTEIALKGFYLK